MALADFLGELDQLVTEATEAFRSAADKDAVEAARVKFLGARSGRLKAIQKSLARIPPADRPQAGRRFNEAKQQLEAAWQEAQQRTSRPAAARAQLVGFDPTIPGQRPRLGHLHPITQTIEEMKDIMGRLGFVPADGPEVEDEWHNFEALNIPLEHPARDPLDNFYLAAASCALPAGRSTGRAASVSAADSSASGSAGDTPKVNSSAGTKPAAGPGDAAPVYLLRSQTSTVQIRVMENTRPPVRIISIGRVYRPDTADATHYPMFQQMEGLLVDRRVTMADLKSILRLFALAFFQEDVHIRFRPSFFPFTEPSVEVDMSWHGGWIEMGGAGMVDPNVLQAVGYDPEEYTGLAFGLGVERICMRRYGIDDIREFYKNDVRFLRQF